MEQTELNSLRGKIDSIDDRITRLFNERMQAAAGVAQYKKEQGLTVVNRSREREVLSRVCEETDPALSGYTKILFSVLFDLSRSYQNSLITPETELTKKIRDAIQNTPVLFPQKATVACQGVEGAYSQMACDKLFSLPGILYFRHFEGVFQAVDKGLCRYGILPIENSSYGSVTEVYDLMNRYHFHIARGVRLCISHALLAKTDVKDLSQIKEIYSHEQAVGQCSEFLKAHPDIQIRVCENTAVAAKTVADSDRTDIAAISSRNCAELYGLSVLSEEIQNSENNYTRFICISKGLEIYPGAGKISLMLSAPHRPGALYETIAKFSALGLNLTKLESRPVPGKDFEFKFYFDMDASVWSEEVIRLLGDFSRGSEEFTFLGSYSEI